MNPETAADPEDRPLAPPVAPEGGFPWRWAVTGLALLVLVVGAWRAYDWFTDDVARRRAVATGAAPAPAPPARVAPAEPPPVPAARTVRPPAPAAPLATDPPAPAVAGVAGVNKCVQNGQVTYTNEACPDGSESAATAGEGMDANGVTGSTGELPVVVARPSILQNAGADPSQQSAACRYMAAEIERLDFEFKQPLPPQVLDHISSRLSALRAESTASKCAPPPKAAKAAAKPEAKPAPRKRPPPKVVEEKSED